MSSVDVMETRLKLILCKVLLKFELVLQKNLIKSNQQQQQQQQQQGTEQQSNQLTHTQVTPPFLSAICSELIPTEQEAEGQGRSKQELEPQPEAITSQSSSTTTTIIQIHPQELSTTILTESATQHTDHQEQRQTKQEEEEEHATDTTGLITTDQPPNKPKATTPTGPRSAQHANLKGLEQKIPSSSNMPLLKRLRGNDNVTRKPKSKKKRKQQQIMNQCEARARRVTPNPQQGLAACNSEMRTEFMADTSLPTNDEPAIQPNLMIGGILRWGETMPANRYSSHFHPLPPPPRLQQQQNHHHYDPPPHQLHQFMNLAEPLPYQAAPNGYNQYAIHPPVPPHPHTSHPPQVNWNYPGSEPANHDHPSVDYSNYQHPPLFHEPYTSTLSPPDFHPPHIDPSTALDHPEHLVPHLHPHHTNLVDHQFNPSLYYSH